MGDRNATANPYRAATVGISAITETQLWKTAAAAIWKTATTVRSHCLGRSRNIFQDAASDRTPARKVNEYMTADPVVAEAKLLPRPPRLSVTAVMRPSAPNNPSKMKAIPATAMRFPMTRT